ncbi:MAG TPA: hypothetical protein ENJ24_00860 [Gammaproteobacteria bacterium]|nr:hypothetical protein [Gammaproteobacteria bacterium]
MNTASHPPDKEQHGFRLLPVIIVVTAVLLIIPVWLNWYSAAVSLPRYCTDPQQTLTHLQQILTEPRPAGEESRRPYLIAAKLLFLLPRQADESTEAYLRRVENYFQSRCYGH